MATGRSGAGSHSWEGLVALFRLLFPGESTGICSPCFPSRGALRGLRFIGGSDVTPKRPPEKLDAHMIALPRSATFLLLALLLGHRRSAWVVRPQPSLVPGVQICMENPRTINRLIIAVIVAIVIGVVLALLTKGFLTP